MPPATQTNSQTGPSPAPNATTRAAFLVLGYAVSIGFMDNFVQLVAVDGGLWQFHAIRSVMTVTILLALARPLGLRLWPRRLKGVFFRSLVHGLAMVIYFGCLAFLPVATVAAGLFTAPIFTLFISRFVYGARIGPARVMAAAIGFLGVLLVLGLGQGIEPGPLTIFPVAAGAFYALGNIATREWCEGESAETLLAGFFAMLGVFGLLGLAVMAVWQPVVPDGAEGFILRGWVTPTPRFLALTLMQAVGSLIGVGLVIRAYQIAEASRVAIFEYVILPASALWAWVIWGEVLHRDAVIGIVMIVAAGVIIALRGR